MLTACTVLRWLIVVVVCANSAGACSCIAIGVREAANKADAIFRGTVIDIHDAKRDILTEVLQPRKRIAVFSVSRVWKGDVGQTFEIPLPQSSICADWERISPIGSELLVYARRVPNASEYWTSTCFRTALANKSETDFQELGTGKPPSEIGNNTWMISPGVTQESNAPEVYDDAEAYRVYNVLLAQENSFKFAKGTLVIQQDTTNTSYRCLSAETATRFKEAIADLDRASGKPRLLQRLFDSPKPYDLARKDTIEAFFNERAPEDGWNRFYQRYPGSGGVIRLSAVGFNQARTQAVVYTSSSYGSLGGHSGLHLLEKSGGQWKQVLVSCGWGS